MRPELPIVVRFLETGEEWRCDSLEETAVNLEWFDSADPAENAVVSDARGRNVELKIVAHDVVRCLVSDS